MVVGMATLPGLGLRIAGAISRIDTKLIITLIMTMIRASCWEACLPRHFLVTSTMPQPALFALGFPDRSLHVVLYFAIAQT